MTSHDSATTLRTGDHEPGSGLTVWIALRRAHRGGLANLAGYWLDSGRRVPGYVAEALEDLIRGGLLWLGEPDHQSCGVRRITVTDTGSAHYLALCGIHNPHGRVAVSVPRRWAHSPRDQRSHLLTERARVRSGCWSESAGRSCCGQRPPAASPPNPAARPARRWPACHGPLSTFQQAPYRTAAVHRD